MGDGFGTDLPNVNGQRGRSTVSTINGLNASEPSGSNKISLTVNQDAIAEVKILRNSYAPEFGNNGGAQINIVTKSGKKDYFGAGYLFMRNEALNANSFFNNKEGLPRAKYRHTYWGLNVGGPVQIPVAFSQQGKKNLFFFYSLERPHTITPTDAKTVTVPTERERNGDFSQSIVGINTTTGVTSKSFRPRSAPVGHLQRHRPERLLPRPLARHAGQPAGPEHYSAQSVQSERGGAPELLSSPQSGRRSHPWREHL